MIVSLESEATTMAEAATHHSRSYQCIKRTGYLVKSPTSGTKMGRWRKRWIMLVDSIIASPSNGGCDRYVRMEYYKIPDNKKTRDKSGNLSDLKLKGDAQLKNIMQRTTTTKKLP